ncbi:type II toxin-antitoxin system VapC family toxin [Luteolibacter flavescens]|uniref:Type II toxin-antitoxin system VapC family toxin n=1 Tax=Luteolibacter flavescens TaxID=1859460 RepID=A0ABT3FPK7_9BACT|nr:type II toxin-antitoxin system VapC family toxin [Luteolibacter flavescens]MCW1885382.1 type II toxin-antitoxin system VapC family toxin [Luteolibacter flavescens]
MSYLVDTNVFSEQAKPKPDPKVIAWLRQHEGELYVSAITIGEIRRGIERLPDGKRKAQLRQWLQSLCDCMQGRILNFNVSTSHVWGQLKASWEKSGTVVSSLDSQIAATASRHSLTIVTRNTSDFAGTGIKMLNPFT